jgi:hypothetical protein
MDAGALQLDAGPDAREPGSHDNDRQRLHAARA